MFEHDFTKNSYFVDKNTVFIARETFAILFLA